MYLCFHGDRISMEATMEIRPWLLQPWRFGISMAASMEFESPWKLTFELPWRKFNHEIEICRGRRTRRTRAGKFNHESFNSGGSKSEPYPFTTVLGKDCTSMYWRNQNLIHQMAEAVAHARGYNTSLVKSVSASSVCFRVGS